MKENSIKEDIILLKDFTEGNFKRDKLENYKGSYKMGYFYYKDIQQAIEHILSDYKRVLKENEELTISNKEIDKECSRLEKKEVELINENEHYKDLICALETYYDITEEDLEECMKNDR